MSPYFDPTYFASTYFDSTAAVPEVPREGGIVYERRFTNVRPELRPDQDDEFLMLFT